MRSRIAKQILAETPEETKIFVNLYADIVVRVNQLLKEKGLNQKTLAKNLDKSPSEINKWLKGNHNFTLKSIAKLQSELGEAIIYIPKRKEFITGDGNRRRFTVYLNDPIKKNTKFNTVVKTIIPKTRQPVANVS